MSADGDLALALWRRWLEENGTPYVHWSQVDYCFFCMRLPSQEHAEDCMYRQIHDLLTRTTATSSYDYE